MRTSEVGLALIEQFEGFSPTPYLCPAHVWTIGYGHVIREGEQGRLMRVDEPAARALLQQDVGLAERAVARFIRVPLTQNQFDALVSFTFNLGAGALQRSTLRRIINRNEHEAVPVELLRWVWAGGRKLPGLVRRRAAEAALYKAHTAMLSDAGKPSPSWGRGLGEGM
jgi:lysozyme